MRYEISNDRQKLTIVADESDRDWIMRQHGPEDGDGFHSSRTMYDILGALLLGDSELEWIEPADVGALTDAPLLGILPRDDNGNLIPVADYGDAFGVWGFEPYQVRSVQQDLVADGKAVFRASW